MLYNIPPLWQRLLLIIITIFLLFFYLSYLKRYIQLDKTFAKVLSYYFFTKLLLVYHYKISFIYYPL